METIKSWYKNQTSLQKTYVFSNFAKAVTFMDRIGLICDKIHHDSSWEKTMHCLMVEIKLEKENRKETPEELSKKVDEVYYNL